MSQPLTDPEALPPGHPDAVDPGDALGADPDTDTPHEPAP